MYDYIDPACDKFIMECLGFLASPGAADPAKVLDMAMQVGKQNLATMKLLDQAHTEHFGHPEPSPVRMTPKASVLG